MSSKPWRNVQPLKKKIHSPFRGEITLSRVHSVTDLDSTTGWWVCGSVTIAGLSKQKGKSLVNSKVLSPVYMKWWQLPGEILSTFS